MSPMASILIIILSMIGKRMESLKNNKRVWRPE